LSESWWQVVKELAKLMEQEGYREAELSESHVKRNLIAAGFDEGAINRAIEWVEKAIVSGNLSECLSMAQQYHADVRVIHPYESTYIPQKIWIGLLACQKKGIISSELFEKLMEGVRIFDPRGLTEIEVRDILLELLSSLLPDHLVERVSSVIDGHDNNQYH
jgi:uncharacterized protein Smg (DUF494 family)